MREKPARFLCDNKSALAIVKSERATLRTRHAYIREQIERKDNVIIMLLIISITTTVRQGQTASIVQLRDNHAVSVKIENPCVKLDLIREKTSSLNQSLFGGKRMQQFYEVSM